LIDPYVAGPLNDLYGCLSWSLKADWSEACCCDLAVATAVSTCFWVSVVADFLPEYAQSPNTKAITKSNANAAAVKTLLPDFWLGG
jgi:hypothetical protein